MEHDELLGGDLGPAASRENLEGVLRRHLRRRRRLTAGVAGGVLALSLGGGAAIGGVLASSGVPAATGGTRSPRAGVPVPANGAEGNAAHPAAGGGTLQLPASPPPNGLNWGGAGAGAGASQPTVLVPRASGAGSGVVYGDDLVGRPMQRLFERSANGVAVRVFRLSFPRGILPVEPGLPAPAVGAPAQGTPTKGGSTSAATATTGPGTVVPGANPPLPSILPLCDPLSSLLVEVSDAGAVGQVAVPDPVRAPRPVDVVAFQVVGAEEGSPMAVLVVRAGTGVRTVEATFGSGATDSMPVRDGVAVLVTTLPPGSAGAASATHVVALDGSGRTVEQFAVPVAPAIAEPAVCLPVGFGGKLPPAGEPGTSGGGSGSAGSGAVGPATRSTGSVSSPPAASGAPSSAG